MPTVKIVPFPGSPTPNGASGTFLSSDGKTVTVVNGIITNIS